MPETYIMPAGLPEIERLVDERIVAHLKENPPYTYPDDVECYKNVKADLVALSRSVLRSHTPIQVIIGPLDEAADYVFDRTMRVSRGLEKEQA